MFCGLVRGLGGLRCSCAGCFALLCFALLCFALLVWALLVCRFVGLCAGYLVWEFPESFLRAFRYLFVIKFLVLWFDFVRV
jgi:hypothetical protein